MLKAVCRFVVLLLSTFCGLSIFVATFSFALRNFAHYCVILLNAQLSDRDKKKIIIITMIKNVSAVGYFSQEILNHRH